MSTKCRTHFLFPEHLDFIHLFGEGNQVEEGLPGEELSASANEDDLQNGGVMTLESLKE